MDNLTIKVKKSRAKKNPSATVILEGNLTVQNASEIHKKLVETKNNFSKVDVQIQNVTDIDLSIVQLLSTYWKTFDTLNKNLDINFNTSNEIQKLLNNSGFVELYKIYMN